MRNRNEVDDMEYSVEPPIGLARRTCAKVWATLDEATLDKEEEDSEPQSGVFLDSACLSPESILPASFWLQNSDHDERERNIPPTDKKRIEFDESENASSRSFPIGLIASVSVGIVIAVFLFPAIQHVKRSTRSYVAESWRSEINRRVDQYEQINQGSVPGEEMLPINLALSGWREVDSEILAAPALSQGKIAHNANSFFDDIIVHFENDPVMSPHRHNRWTSQCGCDRESTFPHSLDVEGLSDHMLLIMPGQDNPLRSAYGQYILLKDARVFFRELSNVEPPKK
ncbi:MAG: SurA N-terminal domain-containing protein [Planctomycetaceae bacterium]|jgi:hypothetical protein|nr:SurA N-terminal domain-containing protein [Planctomycetaceae bacterium]